MAKPRRHPLPPRTFDERKLALIEKPAGQILWRLHSSRREPVFFGKSGENRFDDPEGEYGVLYVAESEEGAFVERFLRDPSHRYRAISAKEFDSQMLASITVPRALKLVDLASTGPVRMGVDARLSSGPYRTAQLWSRAFYAHPESPNGIVYRSRHNPSQLCVALFDRVGSRLQSKAVGTVRQVLGEESFYALLSRYDVGEM